MMTFGDPCMCYQNVQHTLEKFLLSGQLLDHNWAQQGSNFLGKIVNSTFTVIIFVTFKSTAKYRGRARMQFTKKAKAKWAKHEKNVSFMLSSESKHVLQHTQHALISKKKWTGEVYICSYKVMIYQSFLTIFYFCCGYLKKKKTCIQRSNVHQSMISNVYDLFNLNSSATLSKPLAGVQSQTRAMWCHKGLSH